MRRPALIAARRSRGGYCVAREALQPPKVIETAASSKGGTGEPVTKIGRPARTLAVPLAALAPPVRRCASRADGRDKSPD